MHKNYLFRAAVVLFLITFTNISWANSQKIKIACIGNSITYGSGLKNRLTESYPAQLQALLGSQYEVLNFGVSGATMLKNGNKPYWNTPDYTKLMNSEPDIAFIMLGTNDSKAINRKQMPSFEQDYKDMVSQLRKLKSHPRVVLLLPVKAFSEDKFGISGSYLKDSITRIIQKVAYDEKLEILNLYSVLVDKSELFPDQIHPNSEGAGYIASRVNEFLRQKNTANIDAFSKLKIPFKEQSFYGYACADFIFEGREAKIVKPKKAAKHNPWVWRTRFWGHEPQADIALLERGYHIVYCDVSELYGNHEAIRIWNSFYRSLKTLGFNKKVVLEGMSRGGVYAYNWAAVNPDKVACVYADNPVLDLKSWPGGKGSGPGSKNDWEIFKKDYGYKTEEEAMASKESPVDKTELIVKGKYPMLHVCGDADEAVPFSENTIPFEDKIKELGGNIKVIIKPGAKHHPHSLQNPQPIVDFILKASKN